MNEACITEAREAARCIRDGDEIVTAGGRVFGVTGWGDTFTEARERAYEAAANISFAGAFYRRDIGHRALAYYERKRNGG